MATWADILHWLTPARDFAPSEVPGLLSAMGVVNTVAAFAYTSALARVAAARYRGQAIVAFVFAWVAVALVVLGYVANSYLKANTGLLVDAGLLVWIAAFATALVFVALGTRDVVGRGTRWYEADPGFRDATTTAAFGVPFIDQVFARALAQRGHLNYPFLLIRDIDSPGEQLARMNAQSGLRAGEAVIYLTFSRPYSIVRPALLDGIAPNRHASLWVIDCYSAVYMPESARRRRDGVEHADPRDPAELYVRYMKTLSACRRRSDRVRVIYETLSDFIKVADVDLVINYLRRVIVLEERWHVRAVYFYWQGAVTNQADASYLRWFFSATLELVMPEPMTVPAAFDATFFHFYADPVRVRVGRDLRVDEAALFEVWPPRCAALGQSMRALSFAARPYGFLPFLAAPERARHLANFLFFMAAIDHDTHRPGHRYEAVLGGRRLHGSDLLYALAGEAKRQEMSLFLPAAFADIADAAVAAMFTPPDGHPPADIAGRAEIFRDCARVLLATCDGDAGVLLARAAGRLGGDGGLFARLRAFPIYRDPVGKKAALLAKLLIREGLLTPLDPDALDVAIDHVVMTMALRSGAVRSADPAIRRAIEAGAALDQWQTDLLREASREAMRRLPASSGLRADEIDDLVWSYGRESLRLPAPLAVPDAVHSDLDATLDPAALPAFVATLNGVDPGAEGTWPAAATVRGPFTRYF